MEIKYYEVNEEQARRAKGMWSFRDYIHGSETEEYKKRVDEIYAIGEAAIGRGVDKEKVEYYCERFSRKYAEWKNRGFQIDLRCPSIMITGAGNFPVRKKEKQNAARDKHMELYNLIFSVRDKLNIMGYASEIIKSGDVDAEERLKSKIAELEQLQSDMKAANAHWRKYRTMQGFVPSGWEELDSKIKDDLWQVPYAPFELTNNNAKIKNAKERLERLTKVKSEPVTEKQYKYFKAIRNTELMRLQLIFDSKPDENIRKALKENGYKWSPNNEAWQRQLTNNALYSMKYIEQAFVKSEDEK